MKWMSEDNLAYFWSKLKALLAGKKDVQSAKTSPSAAGDADSFIDTISQDTNGEITATKKRVNALWEESNRPASGSRMFGDRKLRTYLISSSMASADKPPDKMDGNMLHFTWDWAGGFDSQLALLHDNTLWVRSGTGLTGDAQNWNEWYGFFPGKKVNGYYGMLTPAGSDSDWIRTTNTGLIPYQSGGVDGGHNSIGTSTWYFGNIFSTDYNGHHLHLHGATSATMTAESTNPRITFSENEGVQPVHLIYTDYDNYRGPAGLKVVGGTDATPAWFEVEGEVYATSSNISLSSYRSTSYTKSAAGYLRRNAGLVVGGGYVVTNVTLSHNSSSNGLFTLPAGWRPKEVVYGVGMCTTSGTGVTMHIETGGAVKFTSKWGNIASDAEIHFMIAYATT